MILKRNRPGGAETHQVLPDSAPCPGLAPVTYRGGMTTLVIVFGATLALIVGAFLVVAWRDRRRQSSPEDSAAAREAAGTQQRYAAERHGSQGDVWRNGQSQGHP